MSVNSNDNKALLWNLLSKHPNQKKDPSKFQAVLEYRVNEIHRNRFKFGNDLMVMNKDYNSLKSIGLEGRKNVIKKFDVDKMCQTTFTEYKKLIELF